MAGEVSAGHRLFARYAHAPNALGYCGPEGSAALCAVACGDGAGVDVAALARRFSGAWPYQQVIADLAELDDPLDPAVVRAYWTGNELTDAIDRHTFGAALLARIKPQAGRYWSHLTDELLAEAAPTHAFHVLAVYPWSRLLATGRPEPLEVLDSCRIGWATVLEVRPEALRVRMRHLRFDGQRLDLGPEQEEQIGYRIDGAVFVDDVAAGDVVGVHWRFACDRLSAAQAGQLERWTTWQLDAMAPRLARQA